MFESLAGDALQNDCNPPLPSLYPQRWVISAFPAIRAGSQQGDHFLQADLNEAARAADASREANGAVYGERLK
jgi:hypothetical protein